MSRDKIWHLISRKLAGEASNQELQELEQLLKEDPSVYYEYKMMEQIWEAEPETDADYLEATYHLHYKRMEKMGIEPGKTTVSKQNHILNDSSRRLNRNMVLAGSLMLISFFTIAYFFYIKESSINKSASAEAIKEAKVSEVITKKASKTRFVLPDGSTVWLNAGSKLNYEKIGNKDNREVYLTGEGYFDVVHNPNRPFIIHTSTIDVKVLGTEFNVKAYPDDATVETSLIRGSVKVFLKNDPDKAYLLKPNQKLVLYKTLESRIITAKQKDKPAFEVPGVALEKLSFINGTKLPSETAWLKNMLSFKDESFRDVANKMERWYDVEIEFSIPAREEVTLTGSFENETLPQAIQALQFTTRFQFKIDGKKVLIF
jgi:transmembrane sensor